VPDDQAPGDAGAPPPAAGDTPRPTVMKAPPARSRRTPAAAALPLPTAPLAVQPTAVRGTRRERVAVSAGDLHALAPQAPEALCAAAARLLADIAPATLDERKAVLWGHDLQAAYAAAVAGTLALVQEPLVERARAHVDRLTQILAAIDLMAVCGHGRSGLVASLARALNDRIDTPGELAGAVAELRLLLDRLSAATADLADLADRLRQHGSAIERIGHDVAAAALAAQYLALHVQATAPEVARRLDDRALGLTATVAQIRQDDAVHRLQLQRPLDLIALIQNVALVSLPGLLSALAALLALAGARGASPTEARELGYQLCDILAQLRN